MKKFEKINISHDMSQEDREESKRLRDVAKKMNEDEKTDEKEYKFKVRGPPWDMRVVKVSKN